MPSPDATRGIVLTPPDILGLDWPALAARAGLTTIATHFNPSPSFAWHRLEHLLAFLRDEPGEAWRAGCAEHGLAVEHELHVLRDFLPPALFEREPALFRADEDGRRVPAGICVHAPAAIERFCAAAIGAARALAPTTGRHFFWIDDGAAMCRCGKCRGLSDSDQALLLENQTIRALRAEVDAAATVAHLAYARTLTAPKVVPPEPGVFLEFAPIERQWDKPLTDRAAGRGRTHGELLDALEANLAWFGPAGAQVLEYWLDASLHSGWRKPAVKVPWRADVFAADVACYRARGIRHITSFGVFLDADYVERYGEPECVVEYGAGLAPASAVEV